jgi:tRNA (mo5U34)-methyltransferase
MKTVVEPSAFPEDCKALLDSSKRFWDRLSEAKQAIPAPPGGWYPFDSMTALPVISELIGPAYQEIRKSIQDQLVLDIGCADGDLSLLFASWGFSVDALDSARNNFNRLQGAALLSSHLNLPVDVHDLDLDSRFEFPRSKYGLALFLGTLYHLRNPYYLLEHLAFQTSWCILSTRVAQQTPRVKAAIDSEPIAYLADGREINNDSTNYWIFSGAGLLRIVQRTRWAVRSIKRIGCLQSSDPIDPAADERMFLLLQSRVFYPELAVSKETGWYSPEPEPWSWTMKSFSMTVVLPLEKRFSGFELPLFVPAELVFTGSLQVTCRIGNERVGRLVVERPGQATFQGMLPPSALHEPILRLQFEVISNYDGDGRELGVCIPDPIALELSY